MQAAIETQGGVGPAIDALNLHDPKRLAPLPEAHMGPIARIVSAYHLGDPVRPDDSWRPLLRRKRLSPYEKALETISGESSTGLSTDGWRAAT